MKDTQPAPEAREQKSAIPYIPRVATPPIVVLAMRAVLLLEQLSPMLRDQWEHLVINYKIDPRRLALDDDGARMAALMLDELGIQYHEIGATDYERLRDALNKIEGWMKSNVPGAATAQSFDRAQNEGGAAEAESSEQAQAPPEPETGEARPTKEAGAAEAATEPEAPKESEAPHERPPATYSAGKESLDWTKL